MPPVPWREPSNTAARCAVGWLAVACIVALLVMRGPQFSNASVPPRGIADPVIALQMARNVSEVDDVLGEAPSPDREAMRIEQYLDFAFIAAYAGLYLALGRWFGSRLAWVGTICGLAAAGCDVAENFAILRIVNVPLGETTQAMTAAIRDPSLAKWTLAFAATAIFGILFWQMGGVWLRVIGACDALAAAFGFFGLIDNAWLVWAGLPLFAGLIVMAALFARVRGRRVRRTRVV
jgi:hypothetical protein